ncbi:MAG: hypothetical protein NZ580_00125 [Bacteroidia bacterium]|nr:hypothetical protein [Bacteroidia bacterium]MDW8235070.1 TrmH family RNA methyltransferase [Bacteroidia bacterium]
MPPLPHPPKFYAELHHSAHRKATGLYLAVGKKLLIEATNSLPGEAFHAILYREGENLSFLPAHLLGKTYPLPAWQIERISGQETPEGLIAVLHQPKLSLWQSSPPPAVLGERLQDPGNVGTLLRTMEWLGYDTLWLSEDSVDPFHPKVVRASMGSLFRAHVARVSAWEELLRSYEGRTVVADLQGIPAWQVPWRQYDSLYVGSESHGVRLAPPQWIRTTIPPASTTHAESLNAAIAAALLLYTRREAIAGRLHT